MISRVRCSICGAEHDLGQIEPSFRRPDAYFAVPPEKRQGRINGSDEACLIASADGQDLACFVRVILKVPIIDERRSIGWGLWVEVDQEAYWRIATVWNDPNQSAEPPFACTVANDIRGYPSTRGLPGIIQLVGRQLRPSLALAPDSTHPFATEVRAGVPFERALEWRTWVLHEWLDRP
ncbi:MAG TPA: DUF2199 domain-containing protein [Candidatus Dormibacteraeota bacterium]|nr:DUF2199 domain-containing protein [Candidatus Dormibacteraeota bacterium]